MQERSRGWTFSPRHRRYESLLNHFPNISQERCLHFALGFPYVTSLSCLFKHRTRLSKCAGGGMGGGRGVNHLTLLFLGKTREKSPNHTLGKFGW